MAASTAAIASGMATSATRAMRKSESARTPAMPSVSQAPMPRVRNQLGV